MRNRVRFAHLSEFHAPYPPSDHQLLGILQSIHKVHLRESGQGRENQTQRDATAEQIPAMYGHSEIVQITYTKDSVKEEWVVTHLDNWQEGWSVKRGG